VWLPDIAERFNQLSWHDSKLRGICIQRNGERQFDEVTLDLELYSDRQPEGYRRRQAIATFADCRYIRLAFDLENKRLCGDDISQALCEKDCPLKQQIEDKITQEPLQVRPEKERPLMDYYVFKIQLIPPGGEMIIVAKNFDHTFLE
jgi:hypothetical protein